MNGDKVTDAQTPVLYLTREIPWRRDATTASLAALRSAQPMGNLVTTFVFNGPAEKACALQKWCHNAQMLEQHLPIRAVVLTNRFSEVTNLCPHALVRGFDAQLTAAIGRYRVAGPACPDTLYKLQILDEETFPRPVVYLDADVDLSLGRRLSNQFAQMNVTHWRMLWRRFQRSSCMIQATPDHSALVNDGVMIVKPNRHMYVQSLRILNRSAFSLRDGYQHHGLPQKAIPDPSPLVKRARGYWANTWNYVCAAGGQGLFAHLSMTGTSGQFCVPDDWLIRVRHFWADDKPWRLNTCSRYYDFPVPETSLCKAYLDDKRRQASSACKGREWPLL